MLTLVGGRDGISADYYDGAAPDPPLTVYTFPNPWVNKNFGIKPTALGDPSKVEWILVDKALFQPADAQLFDRLLATEFTVREQQGTVVLAQRVKPPAHATGPP